MIRERDKQILTRAVVSELISALKFKCELAEPNYLCIVRMVLQDFGEPLGGDDWAALAMASGGAGSGFETNTGGVGEDSESRRELATAANNNNAGIGGNGGGDTWTINPK
jgi:hypothetical protein